MEPVVLLDAAGRRRSAATLPGHLRGQVPRNKGMRYPPDPPTVEEIVLVMRHAGDRTHGLRLRGLIVVMWRTGLRISETLALTESDLDADRGAILVRHGKGDKRGEVGMDQWGWELLRAWLAYRGADPRRAAVLLHRRAHARAAPDDDERASTAAAHSREGRRAATLRCASAASRARGRDGARGRAAERHPAPAWARQSRDHVRLPGGNRQRRKHRHRSRAACTSALRQRRSTPAAIGTHLPGGTRALPRPPLGRALRPRRGAGSPLARGRSSRRGGLVSRSRPILRRGWARADDQSLPRARDHDVLR